MESSIEKDPDLSIGTAKELIESVCKTILSEREICISNAYDIPKLTKEVLREMNLVPEQIPEKTKGKDIIKRLLQSLGMIGNGLAELRGLYGTGHGKDGRHVGLQPRHARLAVGISATLSTFLFETHKEQLKIGLDLRQGNIDKGEE
jgi:hypothetical protein